MSIEINKINFEYDDSQLFLEVNIFNQSNFKICFVERRVGAGKKLFIPKKLILDVPIINNKIKFNLNLMDYKEFFMQSNIWDVYLYDSLDDVYYRLYMTQLKGFNTEYSYIGDYKKFIKPFKTNDNKLSIYVKNEFDSVECTSKINDKSILIELTDCLIDYKTHNVTIRIKRRLTRYLNTFVEYIDFPVLDKVTNIDIQTLITLNVSQGDVFECVLVLFQGTNQEYEVDLKSQHVDESYIQLNNFFRCKQFLSYKNCLALFISYNNIFKLKSLEFNSNKLTFDFEFNGQFYNIESIEIVPYNSSNYISLGYNLETYTQNENSKLVIDILDILAILGNVKDKSFLIRLNLSNRLQKAKVIIGATDSIDSYISEKENYICSISKGKSGEAIINIKKKLVTKLAIVGSCYSRAAFSSNNYYNPDYKEKYKVVLTQFHSSLISLADEKNVPFPNSYFKELNPVNQSYLKVDFEKNFFNLLEKSKAEYLILDIYADAQKGIIMLPNGSVITGSMYVEDSKFMMSLPEGTKCYTINQFNEYFEIWKEATYRFTNKLKKCLREERIIINYINATESYINNLGDVEIYKNQIDFIRKSNTIMDSMNDYLKFLLPNAKVIDSRKLKYIGFEHHPEGNSPNHYESGYYKDFMKLVDEIILNK